MKRLHHILPIVLASLMQALPLCAQQPSTKEVTNVKMFGIGSANILDTYLSPEHYNGLEFRFIDQTERHKVTTPTLSSSMLPPSGDLDTPAGLRPSPTKPKSP